MLFWDQITPTPPADAAGIHAHIIGGGLAGLAAAAFLVDDAGIPGPNVTIYEALPVAGGALDGIGDAEHGYVNRGERELEAHMECLWYLFGKVPSLRRPGKTVLDETRVFNVKEPIHSHWRLLEHQGRRADYSGPGLPNRRDAQDLMRLFTTPEEELADIPADQWFQQSFFESNLWYFFHSMLSFDTYHSVMEMRRYFLRFMHLGEPASTLEGIIHTEFDEYDAMIKPLVEWLKGFGVVLRTGVSVTDIPVHTQEGCTRATALELRTGESTETLELGERDFVFFTNGSLPQNSTRGDNTTPVPWNFDRQDRGVFTVWERLAARDEKFGHPEKFISQPEKTLWTSFFLTVNEFPEFIHRIVAASGDKPGNGGIVTIKDSSWDMSIIVHSKPFYPNQPETTEVVWGYGLRSNNVGDYVKKRMRDCTGNEILQELLYHLGWLDIADGLIAHTHVSLAGMPYITSQFMPRALGDRPRVIPEGSENLAFMGQFVETDSDAVFTVETSVRTALEAVYGLLHLDRPTIPVSPTRYDLRYFLASVRAMTGGERISVKDLLGLALPAIAHPQQMKRLLMSAPRADDVRPGAEPTLIGSVPTGRGE